MSAQRFPAVARSEVPWLTVADMVEADRLAIEEFDITLLQMMEHAGASLAELTQHLYPEGGVTILAGGGNNGGGGLCAARHLVNRGRQVAVVMSSDRTRPAVRHHLGTLREMGIELRTEAPDTAVAVDAMVGYGLAGPLRGRAATLARWTEGRKVVSLDVPSGHGSAGAVRPDATLTLALPKETLRDIDSVYLADLGLPAALWERVGLSVGPLFVDSRILRLEDGPSE